MNVYYETFLMSNEASSVMHQLKTVSDTQKSTVVILSI